MLMDPSIAFVAWPFTIISGIFFATLFMIVYLGLHDRTESEKTLVYFGSGFVLSFLSPYFFSLFISGSDALVLIAFPIIFLVGMIIWYFICQLVRKIITKDW